MVHSEGFAEGEPLWTVLAADKGGTMAEPAAEAEEEPLIAVETKLDVGESG